LKADGKVRGDLRKRDRALRKVLVRPPTNLSKEWEVRDGVLHE
jgi:hypothetical protein